MSVNRDHDLQRRYKRLSDLQQAIALANRVKLLLLNDPGGKKLMPVQKALGYRLEGLRIEAAALREETQKLEGDRQ